MGAPVPSFEVPSWLARQMSMVWEQNGIVVREVPLNECEYCKRYGKIHTNCEGCGALVKPVVLTADQMRKMREASR